METSLLLYLVFLKLFYLLYSGLLAFPSFLAFKTFISLDHLPPNIRIFPVFLAVSTTDKPVNRSIHDYALT